MDKGWSACGSDWKRPCPDVPRKRFEPSSCKSIHSAAVWKQSRRWREDYGQPGNGIIPKPEMHKLGFEKTTESGIQRNPQHPVRGLGIAAAGVDRVGMTSRRSNPPRNNHYN